MRIALAALLTAGATAEITTSFALPSMSILGTDRITYVASVLGAEKDRMTLVADLMPGPDYEAIGMAGGPITWTLASTLFEHSEDMNMAGPTATPGEWSLSFRCEMQTTDASATCTQSIGANIARLVRCNEPNTNNPPTAMTREWTISNSGTQEVETVIRTFPGSPTTPPPDWCSAISSGQGAVPSSALSDEIMLDRSELTTFTFIITAGEEKLPSATTGGTPNDSSAEPTGTEAPEGTGAASEETGAAMPMRTLAPALAGLGAAVAAFL